MQINYYYEPPSIVTANTTWLGDNAETALLYGSLLEAYTFMKGDADLMAQYRAAQVSYGCVQKNWWFTSTGWLS